MDMRLRDLLAELRAKVGPNPFEVPTNAMTNGNISRMPQDLDFGHPKFEQTRACLLQHFTDNPETRVIVFCEYRESVMLIYRLLLQNPPILKPRCLVGQGSAGPLRAITQKQQIEVMSDFRSGKCNVLVATSIGEEGLDVGEVDLIVCFDISTSNPTRFVQRIGRTGRKRKGKVIMLVTEGREQQLLQDVLSTKDSANKKLLNSSVIRNALYKHAPRMVPTELNPQCVHTHVHASDDVEAATTLKQKPTKAGKKTAKAKPKNVIKTKTLKSIWQQTKKLDDEEENVFETSMRIDDVPNNTESKPHKAANDMRTFFNSANISNIATASKQENGMRSDAGRLRRLNKMLKSVASLVPERQRLTEPLKVLRNLKSSEAKLLFLKLQPEVVHAANEAMSIVQNVDVDNQTTLSAEERKIREDYRLIEEVFESKQEMQLFLSNAQQEEKERKCAAKDDYAEQDLHACIDNIFVGLKPYDPNFDAFDRIEREVQETQRYKKLMNKKKATIVAESMVFESFCDSDSSQNENASTTLNDSMFSALPIAAPDVKKSTKLKAPLAGPLVKAFDRQHKKALAFTNSAADVSDEETSFLSAFNLINSTRNNTPLKQAKEDAACAATPKQQAITITNSSTPKPAVLQSAASSSFAENIFASELDIDLDAFMEPFSQENLDFAETEKVVKSSAFFVLSGGSTTRTSPDLFAEEITSPAKKENAIQVKKPSLSAKLAAHLAKLESSSGPTARENNGTAKVSSSASKTLLPIKTAVSCAASCKLTAQLPKMETNAACCEKNVAQSSNLANDAVRPALANNLAAETNMEDFENYLEPSQNVSPCVELCDDDVVAEAFIPMHLSSKLSTLVASLKCDSSPENLMHKKVLSPRNQPNHKNMQKPENKHEMSKSALDDNSIVRRPKSKKRKILESDEESNGNETTSEQENTFVGSEEIAATQQVELSRFLRQPKKRMRIAEFFDNEAVASDADDSEDERNEHTLGHFVCDSVIVSSDEEADNAASTTIMQAVYLQSLKSPKQQRGAFKIPEFRVYNDRAQIYSQAPPIESSQYVSDSFVVDVDDDDEISADETMCPLERAEKILKEQRRAKRLSNKAAGKHAKRRRVQQLRDSSDEEFI